MAYAHFESQDPRLLVSSKIAHTPSALVHFLAGSCFILDNDGDDDSDDRCSGGVSGPGGGGGHAYEQIHDKVVSDPDSSWSREGEGEEMTPLRASERALSLLQSAVVIAQKQVQELRRDRDREMERATSQHQNQQQNQQHIGRDSDSLGRDRGDQEQEGAGALLQRYQEVVFNVSPRVTHPHSHSGSSSSGGLRGRESGESDRMSKSKSKRHYGSSNINNTSGSAEDYNCL